jgi:glyoxylase-like metal-dependent hydrolase (beta-lactamase superfamily II)
MSPVVREAEPGIFVIDHRFVGSEELIASFLLPGADGLTLVESGPASTLPRLLEGIRAAGFDPADLRRVVLTHVHLDHAGGAGSLLRHAPRAVVYAHPAGVPHLVDPAKLLRSARRIYGDAMDSLWGEVLPVPADRVVALADGEELPAGGRVLRAAFTPGHAGHHLALHEPEAGVVFTGDVAGVRLPGSPYVRPPTPPPDVDLVLWRESVGRIRALGPRRLYLTHFGGFDAPGPHLDALLARLFFWAGWTEAQREQGASAGDVAAGLRRLGDAEIQAAGGDGELVSRYELAVGYEMIAEGLLRHLGRAAWGDS